MLRVSNTLSGKKEEIKPIQPGCIGMYNCGPTVYDYAHVGNLRSYVFADILRRTLEFGGLKVTQVINITDIGHLASDADDGEDKMTKGLRRENKPLTLDAMRELADFYTERFKEDLTGLNIELPTHLPKASEHIKEDIELIKQLEVKGFTYTTSDGVYFDTEKDPDYGKLGNLPGSKAEKAGTEKTNDQQEQETKSRIGINTEKRNQRDFAVWKFNNALGFESPWGKGFPGWHIECSAMSTKYLGQPFDIHTGGVDHIPVHHNNEIAQSESATGKPYVHYWLHNAFLIIAGGKMAKSEGNFIRLQTLKDHHISPLAYRYWLLTGRYSAPMTFSWEALESAQNALRKLQERFVELESEKETNIIHKKIDATKEKVSAAQQTNTSQENTAAAQTQTNSINPEYLKKFTDAVNDDLDTPQAIALVWELLSDAAVSNADKKAMLLKFDSVLGLNLASLSAENQTPLPPEILKLLSDRETARANKNWQLADDLRTTIEQKGYEIKDTDSGPRLTKKH